MAICVIIAVVANRKDTQFNDDVPFRSAERDAKLDWQGAASRIGIGTLKNLNSEAGRGG
jgi:hypothetical protein